MTNSLFVCSPMALSLGADAPDTVMVAPFVAANCATLSDEFSSFIQQLVVGVLVMFRHDTSRCDLLYGYTVLPESL